MCDLLALVFTPVGVSQMAGLGRIDQHSGIYFIAYSHGVSPAWRRGPMHEQKR